MYHPPFVDFVTKYPFAEDNFRLAANWIQFYTVNGERGLAMAFQLLTGDEDDWGKGFTRLTELPPPELMGQEKSSKLNTG